MPARLAVAALVLVCAIAVPLRLSADAWAYAAYGALLTHGVDPWAHAFRGADVAALHDPLIDAALRAWDGSLPRDVYGPLFTVPCAVIVAVTRPFGKGAAITAMRLAAALALLVCIALAGRTRPRLATLLSIHPVVLWSAAEGHNDALWLALVLLAGRFREDGRRVATLIAAAAVKAVALIPLAAALVWPHRERARLARVSLGVLALAYAPLGWSVIAHGFDRGLGLPRISLLHAPALAAASGSPLPLIVAAVLAGIAVATALRALRTGDLLAGPGLLGWILLPAPEPWYATWLVPVSALAGPTPASRALLVASFTGVAGYLQDVGAGTVLRDPAFLGGTMLALYALPLLVALASPSPVPQPLPAPVTPAPVATALPTPPVPIATTTPTPPALPSPIPSPSPNPIPSPSPSPVPTMSPSPAPSPSASASPFAYIVDPEPGPSGAPRIMEIALNDRILHRGGMLLVKVTTSADVTTLIARAMGHEIGIPLMAPGIFAGQQQLPDGIPSFLLNRNYQVEFVASTVDGRSASFSVQIRLER